MIPYDLLAKAKTMEAVERSVIVRDCREQRKDETQKIFRPVKINICHYTFVHIYSIYMGFPGGSDSKKRGTMRGLWAWQPARGVVGWWEGRGLRYTGRETSLCQVPSYKQGVHSHHPHTVNMEILYQEYT